MKPPCPSLLQDRSALHHACWLRPVTTNAQPPRDWDGGDAMSQQPTVFQAVAGDPEDVGTGEGGNFFFLVFMGHHILFAMVVTTEGAQHTCVPMSVGTILVEVAPASTNCCEHLHLHQPPKLQAFEAPSFWSLTVCGHKRVFSS